MRMLACVDLRRSEPEFVVDEAASWAADAGARVDLLFARTGDPAPEHEAALRALLERVPEAHRGEALMPEGAAVDVIVKTSANYDLAVIGPREPGPIERVLLGSIAARVVRVARAPVLVVRPRRERQGPLRMRSRSWCNSIPPASRGSGSLAAHPPPSCGPAWSCD